MPYINAFVCFLFFLLLLSPLAVLFATAFRGNASTPFRGTLKVLSWRYRYMLQFLYATLFFISLIRSFGLFPFAFFFSLSLRQRFVAMHRQRFVVP